MHPELDFRRSSPRSGRPPARRLIPLFAATALATLSASARAEQFVLFQQTFEITKATVDKAGSHYFVRGAQLNQPPGSNWTAPVDYRNGDVHIRTEVLEKPAGGEPNHWSYCYMPNRPIGPGYGCAGSGRYTDVGVYDRVEKMTSWWQNTAISWPQGIKEMHLVIKGTGDSGHLHKRSDVEKLYPSKVRITMVQISAGGTFDPSKVPGWTAKPESDAGAGSTADAGTGNEAGAGGGTSPGSGGSSGANGNGGTGGSGSAEPAGSGGAASSASGGAPAQSGPPGTGGASGGLGGSAGSGSAGNGESGQAPGDKPNGGAGKSSTASDDTVTGGCSLASRPGPGGLSFGAFAMALWGASLARAARRRRTVSSGRR